MHANERVCGFHYADNLVSLRVLPTVRAALIYSLQRLASLRRNRPEKAETSDCTERTRLDSRALDNQRTPSLPLPFALLPRLIPFIYQLKSIIEALL